jgi:hypothetical protein
VTISAEQILDALRGAWPTVGLVAEPRPLTGGYWATILHLRLTGVLGRHDLVDVLDTLARHTPTQGEDVVCHGDLHPFNLLIDGDRISVLDWTAALVAPPAYDVALTRLLLRYPPLVAPPALRPLIGAGARALARRFVHRYHHANPTADLTNLDWYTGLHATRVLIDLATWHSTGDARATDHPWTLIAPGAVTELTRITGIGLIRPKAEHQAHANRR